MRAWVFPSYREDFPPDPLSKNISQRTPFNPRSYRHNIHSTALPTLPRKPSGLLLFAAFSGVGRVVLHIALRLFLAVVLWLAGNFFCLLVLGAPEVLLLVRVVSAVYDFASLFVPSTLVPSRPPRLFRIYCDLPISHPSILLPLSLLADDETCPIMAMLAGLMLALLLRVRH